MKFINFKKSLLALIVLLSIPVQGQEKETKAKLVVGIVVDQMRFDYLTRFQSQYGEEGFLRLMKEGFQSRNTHFNYVPTYTGPGHASVFTGATPSSHGIISNNWYNKFEKQQVYCAGDSTVNTVGIDGDAGQMSPSRMLTTTITDQNRLHTQMRGKTIGISLKDRGAILPAGHTANAAYWFEGGKEGKWITSTFYMDELPEWVEQFNASAKAKEYLRIWDTAKPITSYNESGADLNIYEGGFRGKEQATFPYDLKELADENGGYSILKSTPFGNSLTADFAIEALEAEGLGQDSDTDFLTVSFSATDYVGHNFGVNSKEVEDTYIRLDQDLGRLLQALDQKVGAGNYTVFLTADHGAVNVPAYLSDHKIPSGYFDNRAFEAAVTEFVSSEYGVNGLIEDISNYQVFFNYEALKSASIDAEDLQKRIAYFALQYDAMDKVYTRSELNSSNYTDGVAALIQKGFNQKRSGDVFLVLAPGMISYSDTGSTHGSGFSYDTHAPLLFYGAGIKKGISYRQTAITDIAPTIAALLGIEFPNGLTGTIITEVLE